MRSYKTTSDEQQPPRLLSQRAIVATREVRLERFATKMRMAVALAHTSCRAAVWFAILYAARWLGPLADFLVDALGRPTVLLQCAYAIQAAVLEHGQDWVTLLVLLAILDLVARVQPHRGIWPSMAFRVWHYVSLWVPLFTVTAFTIGLFAPLLQANR